MDECCVAKEKELEILRGKQRNVLLTVLIINGLLFLVEMVAGLLAHSTALLADSLDMFGDALVYGFSLYVLWRSARWKARAALLKASLMALFGIAVLMEAIHKMVSGVVPVAEVMGIIGLLVLLGNGICCLLLFHHRSDDINMRSTWLCSRNDIIANFSVLGAAAGVKLLNSNWPDIIVGVVIAALFLKSAFTVLRESVGELKVPEAELDTIRFPLSSGKLPTSRGASGHRTA